MNALLEAALARAREGAYVIPIWWTDADGTCACPKRGRCTSAGKHPLTARGLKDASREPNTIQRWWAEWPEANLAVRTDDDVRVDIDLVEAGDGLLAADPELPFLTEVVRTPKGGLHIALRCPGTKTSKLHLTGGHVLGDLKASDAYVLVPPSRIGARGYALVSPEWIEPSAVADPLAWLADRLRLCGLTLAGTARTPAYRDVDATVPEGSRHDALKSHAGLVWVEGISPAAFAAALHAINETICDPPLPRDEVEAIAQHFVSRREQRQPVAHLGTLEPDTTRYVTPVQSLGEWLDGEDPPLDVVLGDGKDGAILPIDGKGFVAGSTGIGKTNILLRLGRCLAEGTPFLGRFPVPEPRVVLHVALEGSRRGMRRRLRKVWGDAPSDIKSRYFLEFTQLNLSTPEGVEELDRLISETRADVVIIDPLRNAHTWDENDSRETALLTSTLDGIIARHRCALIAAHHDRKKPPMTKRDSGTDRIRGSTALAGWLSFCLSVEKDKTPDTLIAEWTKIRDAEEGIPELLLAFDRETLDYEATERTAASKVSDDDVLTAVFLAGPEGIRKKELVAMVCQSTGAGDRTVQDRIRDLAKDGRLIEFIADEDRARRAKSYRLPEEDQ